MAIIFSAPGTQKPITVCAHCLKALTTPEIKLTFEGTVTIWDDRAKRYDVTLDYCSIGKGEIEKAILTSTRDAEAREDEIHRMDEEDAQKRLAGKPT